MTSRVPTRRPLPLRAAATLLLLVSACSSPSQPVAQAPAAAFTYRGYFQPSFIPDASVVIKTGGPGRVTLTIFKHFDGNEVAYADSAGLSACEAAAFLAALDGVPLLQLTTGTQMGTDGITVENTVTQNGQRNRFSFWSPRKYRNPQEHQLAEAVMGLVDRKFPGPKPQQYLKSLEGYFDFGLPCKITRVAPFEAQIYGALSANEDQALHQFVYALPINQPVLLDLTNFNGMGTMFYPLFRELIARNPQVVWVLPLQSSWYEQANSPQRHDNLQQLLAIGVPKKQIAVTLAEGRALVSSFPHLPADSPR